MGASRALFHQHIIAILVDQAGDQMIDEARIHERRIGGDAHDDIGIELFGGAGETGQHIVFGAAHHGDAVCRAEFHNRLVERIGRGGDGDLLDQLRGFEAMDDVPEQRLARDRLQHFARQAGRSHPRLDDCNNSRLGRTSRIHAASPL